jgi:hypothetical protein
MDIPDRVELAMFVYCGGNGDSISKPRLVGLFKVMNDSLQYFGDKPLHVSQLETLVDSIYTLNGKIEGDIGRLDAITLMFQHPIVELLLSIQFQGTAILKTAGTVG